MKKLNTFQKYFVEEFYDDYREGTISRRTFIRRVAYITGGMAAAASTMSLLGCSAEELPDPTAPIPTAEPTDPLVDPTATTPPDPTATTPPDPTAEPTEEVVVSETTEPEAIVQPVSGAKSPYSVPIGDPAVEAGIVAFESQGDQIAGYLAQPAEEGVYPAVLVCHENRGLNLHIEDVARRFAKEGYVALAIDLLSREGGSSTFDRDEVPGLLSNASSERHVNDFIAGFDYLQSLDSVDGERIGMTGYCFGGGITWRMAVAEPDLKAAVPFYGVGPELDQVGNINAAVMGVYAEMDERINAGKDALDQALTEAGVTHQMNVYPGVNHAFHNDTGERYVEEQATQAWLDTLAWFEEYL
ncbi:MAG: dienelactone hydrolase family protein [Anaerolineae bacterium]|nr:dienelactone hydrolase family protein [Anaerolineae bacterium]